MRYLFKNLVIAVVIVCSPCETYDYIHTSTVYKPDTQDIEALPEITNNQLDFDHDVGQLILDDYVDDLLDLNINQDEKFTSQPEDLQYPMYLDKLYEPQLKHIKLQDILPPFTPDYNILFDNDPIDEIGGKFLLIPEQMLDGVIGLLDLISPDHSDSVILRMIDIKQLPSRRNISSIFLDNLIRRQARFVARFDDYRLGWIDDLPDYDNDKMINEQLDVLIDSLKDTYISKYKLRWDERVRDEAFKFSDWNGLDFILLPPIITAYLYQRGFDKRIDISGAEVRLTIDPIYRWLKDEDLTAAITIEAGIQNFPIKLIVSAGLDDSELEFEFVGIGTSASLIKQLITK